jgi:hypothetical protein
MDKRWSSRASSSATDMTRSRATPSSIARGMPSSREDHHIRAVPKKCIREVDACAAEAPKLAATHDPGKALELWILCHARFIATKRGATAPVRCQEAKASRRLLRLSTLKNHSVDAPAPKPIAMTVIAVETSKKKVMG